MTVNRRTALAGMTAAGAVLSVRETAARVGGGSGSGPPLGGWDTDAHGLPVYGFTGDLPVETLTPSGHPYPLDPDPVFLLGNDYLTLFAFASGRLLFMSGEHGWVRLNEPARTAPGHAATLTVTENGATRTFDMIGMRGVCASGRQATRSFGCGTAHYRLTPQPGLVVERILSLAPTVAARRHGAAVIVTIRMTNVGLTPLGIDHVETVLSNPAIGSRHAPAASALQVRFVNRARLLPGGDGVICEATAIGDDPRLLTPIDTPNRYNLYPPSLVLMTAASAGSAPVTFEQRGTESGAVALSARSRMQLQPGETRDIVLVIALVSPGAALAPVAQFAAALAPSATGTWFREDWAGVLAPLGTVPDPTLRAELLWDGHALLAMSTYAAYYGQTFIPQGMTYDYHLDLNAGPRDHLQHAMAAAYFAPGLARSALLYTLCTMTEEGGIKFTVSGNGQTADSSWTTSDQQLFLLYALGEYLRITRDWSLLDVETPYLPRERQVSGTVLQKLERAFIYLRDHVGTGPHGLVRLLNADWNDQIYAGVATGKDRNAAESQMNSAMVMAVMPPLIEQLNRYVGTRPSDHAAAVRRLTRDMQLYVDAVTGAMMRDMAGRTFARRAWLGSGRALGDDDMYLEPQSFLLMAPGFPVERKRVLLREMQRRLIDGETLGPRQRERPAADGRMQPGTSENGGFWYSLAGQAVAGVATFDRAAALTLLDRMTFRTFSRRHPHYWVGQWTAPDTLNADAVGDIAGLPRPMDDGLWCRMASYCAHAHAWPIYSYFRIRDAGAAGS